MVPKIKEEFKNKVVGYNGRSLPLGKRKDLDILAEIALKSQDKSLIELFEQIPAVEELESKKGQKLIEEIKEEIKKK